MKKCDTNKQDKESHQTFTLGTGAQLCTEYRRAMKSAENTRKMKQKSEKFAFYWNTQELNKFLCQGEYKRAICLATKM